MNRALLLIVVLAALAGPALARPRGAAVARIEGEIAALVSAVEASGGADVAFVSTWSSVNFIRGHAWILTLAVEDAPAYEATYFVLSEIDGRLTGEVLRAPGPEGTSELTGEALASFLARVELDAAPLRAAFERHYRGRR